MIDFQTAINQAYAISKTGIPNTRSLTKEERDDLELKVKVSGGSTGLEIDLTGQQGIERYKTHRKSFEPKQL
jgi:hypothetical protein